MKIKKLKPRINKNAQPKNYKKFGGHVYERLESSGEFVEFELEEDVFNKLNKLVCDGQYVSLGDAVRDILRQMIRNNTKE